jgi:hypothetical protein
VQSPANSISSFWADNRNRIETDPYGRTSLDYEVGYSSKEEAFLNELALRGDRWRYETVFDASDVANSFQKKHFDALVIIAEDLRALALKAVHYLDKIPQGPKTRNTGISETGSGFFLPLWGLVLPQKPPKAASNKRLCLSQFIEIEPQVSSCYL